MNVYNFDFNLRQVVINGLKVKDLENKYERTDYLYCIDNGLVYDDDAHKLIVNLLILLMVVSKLEDLRVVLIVLYILNIMFLRFIVICSMVLFRL